MVKSNTAEFHICLIVFFPSRRKSARENGHDKASSVGSSQTNNGDKIVVKEANTPEVQIVETLKVKIKPRSASH